MGKKSFLIALFLFPVVLLAQKDLFPKPFISLGLYFDPHRAMTDSTGTYSNKILFSRFNVPVYRYSNLATLEDPSKFKYFQISLTGRMSWSKPEISAVKKIHHLYSFSSGVNSFYYWNQKNMMMAQGHLSCFDDNYTISSPDWRLTGYGIYYRKVSDKLGFHGGMAYSYIFGKAYVLPVLGMNTVFTKNLRLNISLPLSAFLVYRPDRSTTISFYIRPSGLNYRFSTDGIPNTKVNDPLLRLKLTEYQAGVSFFHNPDSRVAFEVKTGFNSRRKLSLSGDVYTFKTGLKSSVFINLAVICKFSGKKKNENIHKENNLLDELLQDISPEEIE